MIYEVLNMILRRNCCAVHGCLAAGTLVKEVSLERQDKRREEEVKTPPTYNKEEREKVPAVLTNPKEQRTLPRTTIIANRRTNTKSLQ